MTELKVDGHPGLVRDATTKAIIAKDKSSYESYLTEKMFRENIAKSTQVTQEDLKSVKQEINEIKNMMYALFQKIEQRQG